MSVTYNKPLTESLLSPFHKDYKALLTVDLFSFYLLSRVDIVIRYIEVDLRLGFRIMFVISKNALYRGSLYRGSIPYILLWPGRRISFVISKTSLNRGSLNRGSTVVYNFRMDFPENYCSICLSTEISGIFC